MRDASAGSCRRCCSCWSRRALRWSSSFRKRFSPTASAARRVAAFFGFSNFRLAAGPDYFSPQAEFNPFTHTWSLGVEEQFYLIFPLLIFLLTRGGSDRKGFGLRSVRALRCSRSLTASSNRRPRSTSASIRASAGSGRSARACCSMRCWRATACSKASRCRNRKSSIATFLGSGADRGRASSSGNSQNYPVPGALLAGVRRTASDHCRAAGQGAAVADRLAPEQPYRRGNRPDLIFALSLALAGVRAVSLDRRASARRRKSWWRSAIAIALALISYFFVERPLRTLPWLRAAVARDSACALAAVSSARLGRGPDVRQSPRTSRQAWSLPIARTGIPSRERGTSADCRVEWRTRSRFGCRL